MVRVDEGWSGFGVGPAAPYRTVAIRPYAADRAKYEELSACLSEVLDALQDEKRRAAEREICSAKEVSQRMTSVAGHLCAALCGDVLLNTDGARIAVNRESLVKHSPYFEALFRECEEGVMVEQKSHEVAVRSGLFRDGLTVDGSALDILPLADLRILAEAAALCEQWQLPEVFQRLISELDAEPSCTLHAATRQHPLEFDAQHRPEPTSLPLPSSSPSSLLFSSNANKQCRE